MSFKDIVGHTDVIMMLKEAVKNKRVSPVYIFEGPESIGKKKTALTFAKLLNCASKKDEPCEECLSCRKIEDLSSPDVSVVTGTGKSMRIGIDLIRRLKKDTFLKPYESEYKVFIIDDADTMTPEAANSFLKILEESSGNNICILITSRIQRMLPTIISRSSVMRFKISTVEDVSWMLINKYNLSRKEANATAKFADSRFGMALRMGEEDLFNKKNASIDKLQALLNKGGTNIERTWKYPDRASLKKDIGFFLAWFRDIFIVKVWPDEKFVFNSDRQSELADMSERISFVELEKIITKLIKLESYIESNVNIKLIVDSFLTDLSELRGHFKSRTGLERTAYQADI